MLKVCACDQKSMINFLSWSDEFWDFPSSNSIASYLFNTLFFTFLPMIESIISPETWLFLTLFYPFGFWDLTLLLVVLFDSDLSEELSLSFLATTLSSGKSSIAFCLARTLFFTLEPIMSSIFFDLDSKESILIAEEGAGITLLKDFLIKGWDARI